MSRGISKRWCGAGSTPYSLLHRLKCLLVLLRRQRIFAALAGDSREFVIAHALRVMTGVPGRLILWYRCIAQKYNVPVVR